MDGVQQGPGLAGQALGPQRQTETSTYVSKLGMSIDNLERLFGTLAQRLQPVLRMEPMTEAGNDSAKEVGPSTDLANLYLYTKFHDGN